MDELFIYDFFLFEIGYLILGYYLLAPVHRPQTENAS